MRHYRLVGPQSLSPIVLTCEHASCRLPPGLAPRNADERRILASHWGWDIGAWDVAAELARRLRATAVGGAMSRLVVDLNRAAGDPSLVRSRADGVRLSWNVAVPPDALERRLRLWHTPYHVAIDDQILRRLVRGVRPLLFAVHSFTGVYDGRARDFDMGVLFDRSRDEAHLLMRNLRREGLRVRANQPYSGRAGMMYAIHRHGAHHGLPCLELEMHQDLFTDAAAVRGIGAVVARALRPVISVCGEDD